MGTRNICIICGEDKLSNCECQRKLKIPLEKGWIRDGNIRVNNNIIVTDIKSWHEKYPDGSGYSCIASYELGVAGVQSKQ